MGLVGGGDDDQIDGGMTDGGERIRHDFRIRIDRPHSVALPGADDGQRELGCRRNQRCVEDPADEAEADERDADGCLRPEGDAISQIASRRRAR